MNSTSVRALLSAGVAALVMADLAVERSAGLAAQVATPPGRFASVSFTAEQAAAGGAAYKQHCGSCHGANLDDGEFAPPLKGVEFRGRWGGTQSAEPLFTYMEERMPPSAPRGLGANVYAQILAYWDFDWAFGRLIFSMPVNGTMTKVVATSGKQAIYDIVEAETGKYVSSMDLGLQDAVIGIDPKTGVKQINPRLVPDGRDTITVCPHAGGAKSWIPESINPDTRTLVVPMVEACMDMIPVAPGGRGSLSTGVRWTLRPRPGSDGNYGRLQAINLETKKTLWTVRGAALKIDELRIFELPRIRT